MLMRAPNSIQLHGSRAADASAVVHPTYVRLLCMLLRSLGADLDAALSGTGLSWARLAVEEEMLSFSSVQGLVRTAQELSGKPWLGIDLGQMAQISAHGALGYAVVASRDLGQALETAGRFGSLRNGLLRLEFDANGNGGEGAVLRVHERVDLGEARCFVLDMVFGTAMRLMETVVGFRPTGLRIDLPFVEPAWHEHYQRCTDGVLNFGAALMSFQLNESTLRLPCLTADARAFEAARQDCEQALASHDIGPWSVRVQQQLRQADSRYASQAEVAERLHVSTRTLIRKLKSEGNSYQMLLDGLRQEQALWHLRHSSATVEDIAELLGFEDTSNFSRTVRRWFGVTPSALRERQRGAQASRRF